MTLITNKEKQYYGGNWGKPTDHGKVTNKLPDDENPRIPNRKKKRTKRIFKWGDEDCPFCGEELPIDEEATKKAEVQKIWIFFRSDKIRAKECKCGAKRVEDCPCCHKDTWFKDKIYKHMKRFMWCTFEGERKYVNQET